MWKRRKSRLTSMNRPVPQADPVAYAREKYELENRGSRSLMSKVWGPFADHPSLNNAAKSGTPEMSRLNPTVPRSVPPTAIQAQQTENKVTVEQPSDPNVLDNSPDAIKAEECGRQRRCGNGRRRRHRIDSGSIGGRGGRNRNHGQHRGRIAGQEDGRGSGASSRQ